MKTQNLEKGYSFFSTFLLLATSKLPKAFLQLRLLELEGNLRSHQVQPLHFSDEQAEAAREPGSY